MYLLEHALIAVLDGIAVEPIPEHAAICVPIVFDLVWRPRGDARVWTADGRRILADLVLPRHEFEALPRRSFPSVVVDRVEGEGPFSHRIEGVTLRATAAHECTEIRAIDPGAFVAVGEPDLQRGIVQPVWIPPHLRPREPEPERKTRRPKPKKTREAVDGTSGRVGQETPVIPPDKQRKPPHVRVGEFAPLHSLMLTDEDCWAQSPTSPPHYQNARHQSHTITIRHVRPKRCEHCRSTRLFWNGSGYWCDRCNERTEHEVAEVNTSFAFPGHAGVDLAPVDRWYEDQTALYRVPAAFNTPHGKIRARVNVWNENKPGHAGQYFRRARQNRSIKLRGKP